MGSDNSAAQSIAHHVGFALQQARGNRGDSVGLCGGNEYPGWRTGNEKDAFSTLMDSTCRGARVTQRCGYGPALYLRDEKSWICVFREAEESGRLSSTAK